MNVILPTQLSKHRYLFFGAGEAGIGIAELLSAAIARQTGCTLSEARKCCWFVDSKGLVNAERSEHLEEHKKHFAHDFSKLSNYDGKNKGMCMHLFTLF